MNHKLKDAPTATGASLNIVGSAGNDKPLDKRREPRYPCNDPVDVRILSESHTATLPATALDVSRSGLRLGLGTPIAKGSKIEVSVKQQAMVVGEVCYCRRVNGGFHAGVQILDVVYPLLQAVVHLHDDLLSSYLVGKGLTTAEVFHVTNHLAKCRECRIRLTEVDAILNPISRRTPRRDDIC